MPGALAEPADCNDAIDNDGDGYTDYPNDPGCATAQDDTENSDEEASIPQCNDDLDNDGDGSTDYPDDTDCAHHDDNVEAGPECRDGTDNDGDGWTDYPKESGCSSDQDTTEVPEPAACEDGVDNDGDGWVDYPEDPECLAPGDREESSWHGDPPCAFNGTNCDGMVLRYHREYRTFVGAVGDSDRCTYRRRVIIKKVREGADRVVERLRTEVMGEFEVSRPKASGRFYAVAPRVELEDGECSRRRSNTIRMR